VFIRLNDAVQNRLGVPRGSDPGRIEALHLAEQALALGPNDPRVHHTPRYICLTWRDFDRATRRLDLARVTNPNDAQIQVTWAWAQACLGEPERGLPAAEVAMRLNPRHPRYFEHYLSVSCSSPGATRKHRPSSNGSRPARPWNTPAISGGGPQPAAT
jgi:adenylate cyclase